MFPPGGWHWGLPLNSHDITKVARLRGKKSTAQMVDLCGRCTVKIDPSCHKTRNDPVFGLSGTFWESNKKNPHYTPRKTNIMTLENPHVQ